MKAKISEIFLSQQGEGPYHGLMQIFVRFSGCNLKCAYCDTVTDTFVGYTVSELISEIEKIGDCPDIAITGGEPLLQSSFLKEFLPLLKERNKSIYLETNGIYYQALYSASLRSFLQIFG